MIPKKFQILISSYLIKYRKSLDAYIQGGEEALLYQTITEISQTLITNLIATAPDIVISDLKALNKKYLDLPLKYDRNVIDNIYSQFSIFKGYNPSEYSRKELDRVKRTILQAKYEGWDEKRITKELENSFDMSKRRSLLIARNETQAIENSLHEIYFKNPEVDQNYDLVWVSMSDARPDHLAMNGEIADNTGFFNTPWGRIQGPAQIPSEYHYNCRCTTKFVKKNKKTNV